MRALDLSVFALPIGIWLLFAVLVAVGRGLGGAGRMGAGRPGAGRAGRDGSPPSLDDYELAYLSGPARLAQVAAVDLAGRGLLDLSDEATELLAADGHGLRALTTERTRPHTSGRPSADLHPVARLSWHLTRESGAVPATLPVRHPAVVDLDRRLVAEGVLRSRRGHAVRLAFSWASIAMLVTSAVLSWNLGMAGIAGPLTMTSAVVMAALWFAWVHPDLSVRITRAGRSVLAAEGVTVPPAPACRTCILEALGGPRWRSAETLPTTHAVAVEGAAAVWRSAPVSALVLGGVVYGRHGGTEVLPAPVRTDDVALAGSGV